MGRRVAEPRSLPLGLVRLADHLLRGAALTVQLAVVSLAIGLTFGMFLALAKLSRFAPLRWLAQGYTLFIRGVPEFLILLLAFFGTEKAVAAGAALLGLEGGIEVPKFAAAYMEAVWEHTWMAEWVEAATNEEWVIEQFEVEPA